MKTDQIWYRQRRWDRWLTDLFRMELEFVKVVKNSVIFVVDGAVVGKPANQSVLGVVSSDDSALGQVHDSLAQELVAGLKTDNQLGHHELVVLRRSLLLTLLLCLLSCTSTQLMLLLLLSSFILAICLQSHSVATSSAKCNRCSSPSSLVCGQLLTIYDIVWHLPQRHIGCCKGWSGSNWQVQVPSNI